MSERAIDQTFGERSEELSPFGSPQRARTAKGTWFDAGVGPSTGRSAECATVCPAAHAAEAFGQFAVRELGQELPRSMAGLREAAVLSAHAANAIFRAAEEEEQRQLEKEQDAEISRMRQVRLERCRAQLSEEKRERGILKRKVGVLSRMAPTLKKARQETQEAKMAEFAALRALELVRAELAQEKAKNAELMMAEIARESAREANKAAQEERDRKRAGVRQA